MYVAIGNDGYIAYSSDGDNWTTVKPGYVDYSTITYTNGKFIALGGSSYNGQLVYSENGISWTSVKSPLGYNGTMAGITYGGGKYCLVADYGLMYISNDLKSWSKATDYILVKETNWVDIAYGDGKFVAVGRTTSGTDRAMYSEDGTNWTVTDSSAGITKIYFEHNQFLSFFLSSLYTSTDGNLWVRKSLEFNIKSLSYANGKLVILTWERAASLSTDDGINWSTPKQITDNLGNPVTTHLNGICVIP